MKVTRESLTSYNINPAYFFQTRKDRNAYFDANDSALYPGLYCAIGGDPTSTDYTLPVWEMEVYNGTNWTLQTLDPNYSLIVTNEGLAALANPKTGEYKLQISALKINSDVIKNPPKPIIQWSNSDFVNWGQGIVLDTTNTDNTTFTLENNLKWRANLSNGGIQFVVNINPETEGYRGNAQIVEKTYTIGAIGLYMKDPQTGENILFAVGNLAGPITKNVTTPNRVGNSIKIYLNTVISNLGTLADVTILNTSVNSVPEVITEKDLINGDKSETSPYNLYLVDNLYGTNQPAIAVRSGNPIDKNLKWAFITPTDDSIAITDDMISDDLQDYMAATWDSNKEKFVPADGGGQQIIDTNTNSSLTGIRVGKNIIFAGQIVNFSTSNVYSVTTPKTGKDYSVGDIVEYKYDDDVTFRIYISKVDDNGSVVQYSVTPTTGNKEINETEVVVKNVTVQNEDATGLTIGISTSKNSDNIYPWNFPPEYLNKPLYVDTDKNVGKFTIIPTELFVGWCTQTGETSAIRLALDLRNEATYTDYGTTRYATDNEVSAPQGKATAEVTSVTPKDLQNNYIQKTKVAGNPGESAQNPVVVESYVHFNTPVIGKGVEDLPMNFDPKNPDENVSFYGLAYRAWWGDLAEFYEADKAYPAGTLITIGDGVAEITEAKTECNGIISTAPGYELGEKKSDKSLPVALVGKVPVLFARDCAPKFGDKIYLSSTTNGKASTIPFGKCLGKIIDKRDNLDQKDNIMCSVRINF